MPSVGQVETVVRVQKSEFGRTGDETWQLLCIGIVVVVLQQLRIAALADARDRIAHAVNVGRIALRAAIGARAVPRRKWHASVQPVGYCR